MKQFITNCLIIMLFSGFASHLAAVEVCPEGPMISSPTEHYCVTEKDEQEIKHGLYQEFYKGGKKRTTGHFQYGKKHGVWTKWSTKGIMISEEWYENGIKSGSSKKWYLSGQSSLEGHYKAGKPIGPRIEWFLDGRKMSDHNYTHQGKDIHAETQTWYSNGQLQSMSLYINGKPEGLEQFWHKNGELKSEFEYVNGKKHGACWEWYPNGKEKSLTYYKHGKKTGNSWDWHNNGQIKSEGAYLNGKNGTWKYWKSSGILEKQEEYKEGKTVSEAH